MTLRLLCSTDTEADTEDSRELRPLNYIRRQKLLGRLLSLILPSLPAHLAFTPPSSADYDMFHAIRQINVY